MAEKTPGPTTGMSAPILTALNIGTWEWNVRADRVRGDAVAARILGHSADDLDAGMPIARFTATFHPEDAAAGNERRQRALVQGGLFVWEHRVVAGPTAVRWVLARGQFERDTAGRVVRGRGICIDVTGNRLDGDVDGQADFAIGDGSTETALDRAADRALELWAAIDELTPAASDRLRPMVGDVLHEFGRLLAAALAETVRPVERGLH